jgi:hypothetical protein
LYDIYFTVSGFSEISTFTLGREGLNRSRRA